MITVGASILKWVIKNPLLTAALLSLFSMTVYAGTQKIGKMAVEVQLALAKTKLVSCSSALTLQNNMVQALGIERDKLKDDLSLALKDAEEIILDAKVRVKALLAYEKSDDCTGNLGNFIKNLEGVRW